MNFERYQCLWSDTDEGKTLHVGRGPEEFSFDYAPKDGRRYRLFSVGETSQFYQWKNEPDAHYQYALLVDSLDTEHTKVSQYCLNFSSAEPQPYVRRIYKKILWKPVLSYLAMKPVSSAWQAGFFASAEGLVVDRARGGYLHMALEIRYKRDGVSTHSTRKAPDEIITVDFAEGTYDMTEFSAPLRIDPDRTASVAVWIEGKYYSGSVYLERPYLSSAGQNLLPDFSLPVHEHEKFAWLGQYFSRKEWPEFRVRLNGEIVYEGEIFERCHRFSEWELPLPAHLLREHNTLSYELISDYHDPIPYNLHEFGIIDSPCDSLSLICASEVSKVGENAYILLRTEVEHLQVSLSFPSEYGAAPQSVIFADAGLHGIPVHCLRAGLEIPFTVSAGETVLHGRVGRIVEGTDDGVVTGTGDMVYVPQTRQAAEDYLAWYLSNHVGDMITVRPTYRWTGTRVLNPDVWTLFTRLMNECSVKYAAMTDGREPVGLNCNPTDDMLEGDGYLGRQCHEYDGALFYWDNRNLSQLFTKEEYADMFMRIFSEDPEHTWQRYSPENYVFDRCGETEYMFRNPFVPRDMKIAAETALAFIASFCKGTVRHTGPSVYFKYFLQAGMPWVGCETMYGTMEILLSFLRGVKVAYKLPSVGVHHAVQWSSTPHDCPERYRRYRLALYSSYLLDADEINTEEGLWRLEEYYAKHHRFSDACVNHTAQQTDFARYVASHSRTGRFYTPMGLIHGRYDGWLGRGGMDKTWGWRAVDGMPAGIATDAEKSWDLFRTFYPLSKPGFSVVRHDCPSDAPQGYHSPTPYGQVDTLPIEATAFAEENYKTLAFMGYNCADPDDLSRLYDYVSRGGRLILTRPHTTVTTDLEAIRQGKFVYEDNPFLFADGSSEFAEDTYHGIALSVCVNAASADRTVLERTDNGRPLLCRYACGDGEVLLVNANAYPAHPAIRSLYEFLLTSSMTEMITRERVWAEVGDDAEFSVYRQENGDVHLYLLPVDWYRAPETLRRATVRVGDCRYSVEMPFGQMIKCVVHGDTLVYPHGENGEVLSVDEDSVTLQGVGTVPFTLCRNGEAETLSVIFDHPIVTLNF